MSAVFLFVYNKRLNENDLITVVWETQPKDVGYHSHRRAILLLRGLVCQDVKIFSLFKTYTNVQLIHSHTLAHAHSTDHRVSLCAVA